MFLQLWICICIICHRSTLKLHMKFEYHIIIMMTSSNGNIFCVDGHLRGEFNRSPVNSPHRSQWRGDLMFSLICVWINGWVNNREAGDLRRYRAHYDVTLMVERSPAHLCNLSKTTVIDDLAILGTRQNSSHGSALVSLKYSNLSIGIV